MSTTVITNGSTDTNRKDGQPQKILKSESSYTHKNGVRSVGQGKKIMFADEIGETIYQNNYVDQLHYSNTSYSPDAVPRMGCGCTIS